MKYLSICSGIEAASTAWHPLGWEPLAFSEIEKFPSAVLAHHWPDVPNLGDMKKHHEWPTTLQPDLIVGGTPCQAFSVAGLRQGLADPRGNLTLTFLSIIQQYRPRWVVWENVPGVLSDKTGAFGSFLGGLGELGYGFAYRVLDAQYFGVPQRRRRVFVVGCLGDWQRAAAVLFESHSLQGHNPPSRKKRGEIAREFASRTGDSGEPFFLDRAAFNQGENAQYEPAIRQDGVSDALVARGPHAVCMSTGQAGAEIGIGIGTTLNCNHEAPIVCTTQYGDLAGSLTARHDSSACADRGQNVVAYRTSGNCGAYATGDTVGALTTGTDQTSHLLAFSCKDHGIRVVAFSEGYFRCGSGHAPNEEIANTLQCNTGDQRISVAITGTHCIAENIIGRQDHNGGNGVGFQEELAYTLNTVAPPAVAFAQNQRDEVRIMDVAGALAAHPGMKQQTLIAAIPQVRRLTPTECERLQGFPSGHTAITYRGKPSADGPRYKALGNSMAVPVMHWIGQRINQFTK